MNTPAETVAHTCRTCGFTHPQQDCPRWPGLDGGAATGLGICQMDGYVPWGERGDERYWHCEEPAVMTDAAGLVCAEHGEEEEDATSTSP